MVPRFRRLAAPLFVGVVFLLTLFTAARAAESTPAPPAPVLIQLAAPPAAQVFAEVQARGGRAQAVAAVQAQIQRIDSAQRALLAAGPLAEAQLIYRTQRVYNGVGLLVPAERIPDIQALPGVLAVHPLPVHTVALARSTPYLGAPQLWDLVYGAGFDGEAVSIGVIDTGIDYFHRDFGGPGDGFRQNDPTVITDHVAGISFPTLKVVGGYDFAGEAYDAQPGGHPIPDPDPDPVDCWGHGTHVAGIAAGVGVLAEGGVAYTGPYTSGLDFSQFRIGPGVAPRAKLYALKIFGCTGASNLVLPALEWAVDPNQDGDFSDRLDVVNLSVGSPYGAPDDPTAVASDNAALAGVIVVAAAGNSGDSYYIVSSPGTAGRSLSVAASAITGLPIPQKKLAEPNLPAVDSLPSFSARGPRRGDSALKPDVTAPGSSIRSAAMGTGSLATSLSGTSMATPQAAGGLALLRQLHPGWTVEELKALLLNTARYNLIANSAEPPLIYGPGRVGAGRMDLAWARQASIIAYNASDPGLVSVSFGSPSVLHDLSMLKNVRLANKGDITRTLFLAYSPVVDMPGASLRVMGDPLVRLSPHNALNVALLFTAQADELTYVADPTVARRLNFPRYWVSEESGYLYAWPQPMALQAELSGDKMLPAVASPVRGRWDAMLTPQKGALHYTLTLSAPASSDPLTITGAALHMGPVNGDGPTLVPLITETLTGSGALSVTGALTLTREAMDLLAGDYLYVQASTPDFPEGAVRGQVEPQEPVLRLPVYAAPRPASAMRGAQANLDFGPAITGSQVLTLVGQGLLSGASLEQSNFPTDTVSVLSGVELLYSSPNEESSPPSLDHADLKYVGVASDYPDQGDVARTRLIFGVVTYGDWSSPNEMEIRIHLDVDKDGAPEYILRTDNVGDFLGGATSDEFFSVLENVETGASRLAYFRNLVSSGELNTGVFNTNVVLLAVDARDLGLTNQSSGFRFWVSTRSVDTELEGSTVDASALLAYDVAAPGVWVTGGLSGLPIFYDLPGVQVPVQAHRSAFLANRSQGLLLLHHHNEAGARAEVIGVRWGWMQFLPFLPVMGTAP